MSNDNLYCSFTITYVMLNKSIGKFDIYKSYKKLITVQKLYTTKLNSQFMQGEVIFKVKYLTEAPIPNVQTLHYQPGAHGRLETHRAEKSLYGGGFPSLASSLYELRNYYTPRDQFA